MTDSSVINRANGGAHNAITSTVDLPNQSNDRLRSKHNYNNNNISTNSGSIKSDLILSNHLHDAKATHHSNEQQHKSKTPTVRGHAQKSITTMATSRSQLDHTNKNQNHPHHSHKDRHKELATNRTTATNSNDVQKQTKLRRSLDLIDYDDPIQFRARPSAYSTNSISKNLISRLNELSSPVARKLKFWNKKSFQVNQYDPSFKVIYLGNLGMQFLSKDEQCLEKPLNTLWNNYLVYMKSEIVMRLTICNSGLKAITRQHGLTQYWSNRLVYCFTHKNYPKIFSWIYRHEGKKMRQELRCHAVFCPSPEKAAKMVVLLNQRLACALQEFKREKKSRELPSIMTRSNRSSANCSASVQLLQQTLPRTVPLRRQILAKGSANFRPPLDRSKSAPKLTSIREEDYDEEGLEEKGRQEDEEEEEEEEEEKGDDDSEISHDEFEFEQSFGDKDDDESDDDDEDQDGTIKGFEYDEETLKRLVDNLNLIQGEDEEVDERLSSRGRLGSDSLMTTADGATTSNESGSTSATGDNSYETRASPEQSAQQREAKLMNPCNDSGSRLGFDRFASPRLSRRSPARVSSRSGGGMVARARVCATNEAKIDVAAGAGDATSRALNKANELQPTGDNGRRSGSFESDNSDCFSHRSALTPGCHTTARETGHKNGGANCLIDDENVETSANIIEQRNQQCGLGSLVESAVPEKESQGEKGGLQPALKLVHKSGHDDESKATNSSNQNCLDQPQQVTL